MVFTADTLRRPLLVTGRPTLQVSLASPEAPVPVYATLSEATPNGPAWNVADGMSLSDPSTGRVVVELGPIAHEFATGTALRLDVAFTADVRLEPPSPEPRVLDLTPGMAALSLPVASR